jgi:uncharacterized protein (UPF0335 family)
MAEVGDNAAQKQLVLFAERIERLIEDRSAINDDIKDVKAEAKANGYDPKILMQVIKIRAMDRHTYIEQRTILDTYLAAFGIDD